MKNRFTIFLAFITVISLQAQDFDEFFYHDRITYKQVAHFFDDDVLYLIHQNFSPDRTGWMSLESLSNNASEVIFENDVDDWIRYNKITTGIDESRISLNLGFDVNPNEFVPGFISIRSDSDGFEVTDASIAQQLEDVVTSIALISDDPDVNSVLVDNLGEIFLVDENLNIVEQLSISFDDLHQGLDNQFYIIEDGRIGPFNNGDFVLESAVPDHIFIVNDPFQQELVFVSTGQIVTLDNETLAPTNLIDNFPQAAPVFPIELKVTETGYQYLIDNGASSVALYEYDRVTDQHSLIYALADPAFDVRDFEVRGDDIYFFGENNNPSLM